ncbi:MAG: NUDIX domain-containing protein [Chitinivibrionales bacterium]|nr:NUDIX domain-containing protein [Chitinivibrionales bacterium]MBD3395948.1 NUDIX domain-containing protein [Chitinivibrionales bacterium]
MRAHESNTPPPVRVVCAIIQRDAVFLAARRGPEVARAGLWEFPGGKILEGETGHQALKREIREELEVDIEIHERLAPSVHSYADITIELVPFVCEIRQGEPLPREHAEIAWFDTVSARALRWSPADMPVLEQYLALRQQHAFGSGNRHG